MGRSGRPLLGGGEVSGSGSQVLGKGKGISGGRGGVKVSGRQLLGLGAGLARVAAVVWQAEAGSEQFGSRRPGLGPTGFCY